MGPCGPPGAPGRGGSQGFPRPGGCWGSGPRRYLKTNFFGLGRPPVRTGHPIESLRFYNENSMFHKAKSRLHNGKSVFHKDNLYFEKEHFLFYKEISIFSKNHDLGLTNSCVCVFLPTDTFLRPPEIIRKKYKHTFFRLF